MNTSSDDHALQFMTQVYPESQFGGYSRVDGTVEYYNRVQAILKPTDTLLDVGCGRGCRREDPCEFRKNVQNLRNKCSRIIGIDVDPAGADNPWIHEFRLITDLDHWPVEKESIDVVFTDCVLEHVESPSLFFSECHRVLKPNGILCIRTPNFWGYVGLIANCIPNRFHARITGMVQHERSTEDVFPTFYRCNTRSRLKRDLARSGFSSAIYLKEAEPSYFVFSPILFRVMAHIHAILPSTFRSTILAFARKTP
jgi:2-polyprenyl-3-methyl-5-hydroxy-6-metoxy-1,4-benzoquinol methylase